MRGTEMVRIISPPLERGRVARNGASRGESVEGGDGRGADSTRLAALLCSSVRMAAARAGAIRCDSTAMADGARKQGGGTPSSQPRRASRRTTLGNTNAHNHLPCTAAAGRQSRSLCRCRYRFATGPGKAEARTRRRRRQRAVSRAADDAALLSVFTHASPLPAPVCPSYN